MSTCPSDCVEQNHPGREHDQWVREHLRRVGESRRALDDARDREFADMKATIRRVEALAENWCRRETGAYDYALAFDDGMQHAAAELRHALRGVSTPPTQTSSGGDAIEVAVPTFEDPDAVAYVTRHTLTSSGGRWRCTCGNWSPSLGESVHRAFDQHLLDVSPAQTPSGGDA